MTDGCVMNATMREPPNATVKRRRRGGCPLLVRRSTGWTGRRSTPSPATSGAASIPRPSPLKRAILRRREEMASR